MIPFARSSLKCSSESIAHVGNLTHPAGNADDALAIDPALATSTAPAKKLMMVFEKSYRPPINRNLLGQMKIGPIRFEASCGISRIEGSNLKH
jgi:hypothetical protein